MMKWIISKLPRSPIILAGLSVCAIGFLVYMVGQLYAMLEHVLWTHQKYTHECNQILATNEMYSMEEFEADCEYSWNKRRLGIIIMTTGFGATLLFTNGLVRECKNRILSIIKEDRLCKTGLKLD